MIIYSIFPSLTYFTKYNIHHVHPCCILQNFIPFFNGWLVSHCVYLPHLLILSFVDWPLSYFHIFAVVNNAAMNIRVRASFQISVLFWSNIYPEVELLYHMVILFLVFLRNICFSTIATPIDIPTNSGHILANICYLWSFWWESLWQVWGDISLFWFAFSWS